MPRKHPPNSTDLDKEIRKLKRKVLEMRRARVRVKRLPLSRSDSTLVMIHNVREKLQEIIRLETEILLTALERFKEEGYSARQTKPIRDQIESAKVRFDNILSPDGTFLDAIEAFNLAHYLCEDLAEQPPAR